MTPRSVATAAALLAGLATGCASSVHEVEAAGFGAPDVRADVVRKGTWIEARGEQDVILGITDNTDYVDRAFAELTSRCPGEITALSVRASTNLGFLSYTNVVQMRALCLARAGDVVEPSARRGG